MMKQQVQTAFNVLFPPSCTGCGTMVESDYALCGSCWKDLPLIAGPVCHACGVPILTEGQDETAYCEDCRETPPPWSQGRSVLLYKDLARKLVLGLKHGDRQDVAATASTWMAQTAKSVLTEDTIIIPVPLYWARLVQRRYNQSALLAQHLALRTGHQALLDGLVRMKRTKPLEGVSVEERFLRLEGVMSVNSKWTDAIKDRPVLLVDDVLTSGATLSAATNACLDAGAKGVNVLALARAQKGD